MYDVEGRLAVVRGGFKGKLIVVGDIHGDYRAFEGVRKIFAAEPGSLLIFLGDYADRGDHGLEVIEGVQELVERYEERVIALKGNHEDYRDGAPTFYPCDLPGEVEEKRKSWPDFFPHLECGFLKKLFLAALVPGLALFVHGGISSKLRQVDDLKSPSESLERDILWSDPRETLGEHPNPRGAGVLFGPDISERVLGEIGVKFLIRSHEPARALAGPLAEHEGRVITTSSTRVYGGTATALVFKPHAGLTSEELLRNTKHL
jgi:hypothetical protein